MLQASSARNIKLAEDILTPLGIPLPYTDDAGNLTLEFTIEAANVRGAGQVFSSDLAFGTYPLQEVTSSVNPTVLTAHFTNGNDSFVNSRVYLWNPSTSAGEVTVRVFTLPLSGGIHQERTGTPLNLGTLGAESARNIKLVEDILIPLGISVPYTEDGGNLALEFTIQAPNVQGAAQVFSSSVAFGTYPLQ
jgi:outer membrane protein assembly factor BamA